MRGELRSPRIPFFGLFSLFPLRGLGRRPGRAIGPHHHPVAALLFGQQQGLVRAFNQGVDRQPLPRIEARQPQADGHADRGLLVRDGQLAHRLPQPLGNLHAALR